jgi:hypothetical protein
MRAEGASLLPQAVVGASHRAGRDGAETRRRSSPERSHPYALDRFPVGRRETQSTVPLWGANTVLITYPPANTFSILFIAKNNRFGCVTKGKKSYFK